MQNVSSELSTIPIDPSGSVFGTIRNTRLIVWGSKGSTLIMGSDHNLAKDGWWPATRLPRASQTCSIGLMSGEHAGYYIRTIPSSKRKFFSRLARRGLQLSSIKMKASPIAAA
ncbi:hypothetical protein TNCV_1382541 [Trichonephila clavipes]|nr:hypothetical protein TNCV_1382541 [Trichonephila clavipes]